MLVCFVLFFFFTDFNISLWTVICKKSWISMWQLKEKLRESSTAAQVKSNPRALRKLDRFTAVGDWSPNLSGTIVFPRLKKRELRGNRTHYGVKAGDQAASVPLRKRRGMHRHRGSTLMHAHTCLWCFFIPLLKVLNPWAMSWGPFSFLLDWKSSRLGFQKKGVKKKSIRSLLNLAFLTF